MKIIFPLLVLVALGTSETQPFTRFTTQCNFNPGTLNTITQTWGYWNSQQCVSCQQFCTCDSYLGCTLLSCPVGYVANSDQQCILCPTGCAQCTLGSGSNIRKCYECIDGYQLIGKMCVELTMFQIKTSQLKEVYMTYNNPYSQPLNANFSICKALNPRTSLCQECNDGYFLNEYNQCESCPTGCICQQRGTCPICQPKYYYSPTMNQYKAIQDADNSLTSGFYRYGSGSCVACTDPNALDCGYNYSLDCSPGYYLDKTTEECAACVQGCNSCTTSTDCSSCFSGYWLSGTTCTICPGNNNLILQCSLCNSSGQCSQCNLPYQLYNGTCINCGVQFSGCVTCTNSACTQCNNGYYLNQGQCNQCGPNVLYCSDNTGFPTQCVQGYLLVKSADSSSLLTCTANINNCMLMINSEQQCSSCFPERILVQGSCVACSVSILGCTTCGVTSDQLICKACSSNSVTQSNYALDVSTNTCTLCPTGCLNCTTTYCTQCKTGFMLSNGACSSCTLDGCATCTTDGQCLTCQPGYYLLQYANINQCYLCPYGCTSCYPDGNSCQSCKTGYILRNNGCTFGTIFCASYREGGVCQECMYGFALRNGICASCIDFTSGYVCGENAEPCGSPLRISLILSILAIWL